MNSSYRNAGPRIICGLIQLDYSDLTTTTIMTTETSAQTSEGTTEMTGTSEGTTESYSTATARTSEPATGSESTGSESTASNTPSLPTTTSAGLKIQPMILAAIMAMIINSILFF